jgi:hypothetical protein
MAIDHHGGRYFDERFIGRDTRRTCSRIIVLALSSFTIGLLVGFVWLSQEKVIKINIFSHLSNFSEWVWLFIT